MGYNNLSTDRYEKRVVIIIDLLGFKEFIKKEERADTLIKFFNGINSMVSDGLQISSYGLQPALTFFSDTIAISFPLTFFTKEDGTIKGFLAFISGKIAEIQIYALRFGLLTRGGISYGSMYHNDRTWFGPALNEAHEYESKIAIFPRVVLTPSILDLLNDELEIQRNLENPIIQQDDDGLYSIRWFIRMNLFFPGENHQTLHPEIKQIILSNLQNESMPIAAKDKWNWAARSFNQYTQRLNEAGIILPEIKIS